MDSSSPEFLCTALDPASDAHPKNEIIPNSQKNLMDWQFDSSLLGSVSGNCRGGSFPGECESAAAAALFDLNVLGFLSLNLSCHFVLLVFFM